MAHIKVALVTFVFLFLFAFAPSSPAQIKSSYSSLTGKNCRSMKLTKADENVLTHLRCTGVAGYRLDVLVGEEHQYVELITPKGKNFDVSINPASYSSVGKTAEWRMRGATPVGLIVRFDMRGADVNKVADSALVVSKVTRNSACVVDSVYSSKDQNAKARRIADTATGRKCQPGK